MAMRTKLATAIVVVPFALVVGLSFMTHRLYAQRATPTAAAPGTFDAVIEQNMGELFRSGGQIFRFDTFGDERFWSDTLKLNQAIGGVRFGGVGPGVSPATALAVGLKLDVDMVPRPVLSALAAHSIDLNDPANTLALINAKAVVGVMPIGGTGGQPQAFGLTCAFCHSTVDDSFAPGIGHRLDGWPNRDLNVGAIVALSPDLSAVANLLQTDQTTVRTVLNSWGPGKFDAELFLDGKAFRPDGKTAATVIPPAFGLAGVNQHTFTGWGSVPYWNAFVANLEMHGSGVFFDPRLNDKTQFPVAARAGFGNTRKGGTDGITSRLAALQFYQLAIPAPPAPAGSFDARAADHGQQLFNGPARCSTCHVPPLFTEPGWAMHTADEIGIDDFQANRAPDHRYRTTPLKGLWAHAKGGYYHDGRYPTLLSVVQHYNQVFNLRMTDGEMNDLAEYLKSL
jgi:hypothetical protein